MFSVTIFLVYIVYINTALFQQLLILFANSVMGTWINVDLVEYRKNAASQLASVKIVDIFIFWATLGFHFSDTRINTQAKWMIGYYVSSKLERKFWAMKIGALWFLFTYQHASDFLRDADERNIQYLKNITSHKPHIRLENARHFL